MGPVFRKICSVVPNRKLCVTSTATTARPWRHQACPAALRHPLCQATPAPHCQRWEHQAAPRALC